MGSLPNLNELCREKAQRRAAEKERDLVRERARQRDFTRGDNKDAFTKDRLPMFFQVKHKTVNRCFYYLFVVVVGVVVAVAVTL